MVATGHEDGRVRLWYTANRVARAKAEASTTSAPVAALAHDTAARALVVLPRSGEPRRLDARTLAPLPAYAPLPARRADSPMALARDRAIVALVGADGRVLRWDLDRGRVLAAVAPRVADPVASLTLAPDGSSVAIAHASGRVLFWRAGSDHLATLIDGASLVPRVAFSPDGGFLAVMSQVTTPQLWRLQGLSRVPLDVAAMSSYVQNAPQLGVGARQFLTVSLNPDNVWLWMLGAQRPRPLKLDLEPGALSVARDGLSFAIADGYGAPQVHALPAAAADEACARMSRNMSMKRWREQVSSVLPYTCQCPQLPIAPDDDGRAAPARPSPATCVSSVKSLALR